MSKVFAYDFIFNSMKSSCRLSQISQVFPKMMKLPLEVYMAWQNCHTCMNQEFCTTWQLDMNSMKSMYLSKILIILLFLLMLKLFFILFYFSESRTQCNHDAAAPTPTTLLHTLLQTYTGNKPISKVTTSIWYLHDGTI